MALFAIGYDRSRYLHGLDFDETDFCVRVLWEEQTMFSDRLWLAGLIAGMLMIMSVPMISATIVIHPWAMLLMGLLAVSGLLVPCKYIPWLAGTAVVAYAVIIAFTGTSNGPYWLLETVIEISGILMAGVFVHQISLRLKQFEEAFLQIAIIRRGLNVSSQQAVHEEMEREIRRARRYERPLSLVSFEPIYSSEEELQLLLKTLTSHLGKQILKGQIADLFASQTKANDILSYHDEKFLIMLPETDKAQAEAMARRLNTLCGDSLNISARTSTASFPCEELTLSGLIKRTESLPEKEIPPEYQTAEKAIEDSVLQESS